MSKRLKGLIASILVLVTIFGNVMSASAAVLDTTETTTTINGYRMGAFRVVNSTFTWKGIGHDHMVMTTAVNTSNNVAYSGFCLNAGKYWGDNPDISITSNSQLDPTDDRNAEIIRAVNYWNESVFTKSGQTWDATAVISDIAVKYAIIQLYIWGMVEESAFYSKSTATQANEIASALGGCTFGSSYYGYTAYSAATIESMANTLLTAIKKVDAGYNTEVLISNSSGNQNAAFIISKSLLIGGDFGSASFGTLKLYKTSKLNGADHRVNNNNYSLAGAVFRVYYSSTGTPVQTSTYYVGEFKTNAGGTGYVTYNKFGGSTGNGVFTMTDLPYGNYLVVETQAPANHEKAPDQRFSITESNSEETITLTFDEPALYGELDLIKTSNCKDITDGNEMYDLSGAKYQVYTDAECTTKAYKVLVNSDGETNSNNVANAEFVTDSTGNADAMHILHGTYYIKETVAPEGFDLDTKVYKVVVGNSSAPQVNVDIKAGGYHSYDSHRFTVQVSDSPVNDPINITLNKVDSEGDKTAVSLEGAVFKVDYYSKYFNTVEEAEADTSEDVVKRTWYYETKLVDGVYQILLNKEYLSTEYTNDEIFTDLNGRVTLPLGTVIIREVAAADGYTLDGAVLKDSNDKAYENAVFIGQIKENDNSTSGASLYVDSSTVSGVYAFNSLQSGKDITVSNEVKRGDVEFIKLSHENGGILSNIPFIMSLIDGEGNVIESHVVVTDENGLVDTSSTHISHKTNTNGNDKYLTEDSADVEVFDVAGTWFYGAATGNADTIDDEKGALPYGTYTLTELPCKANADRQLMDDVTFTVSQNGEVVDLGTFYNVPEPEIGTMEWDEETGTHMSIADDSVTVKDTVSYKYLTAGSTYTLKGVLFEILEDGTVTPLLDDNGEMIFSTEQFTVDSDYEKSRYEKCGTVDLTYEFPGASLNGKTFVIYEFLYAGACGKANLPVSADGTIDSSAALTRRNGEVICHMDSTDIDQIGYFPELGTTALDSESGEHISNPDEEVKIIDTVGYVNLAVGKEYTINGTLMDKATGLAVLDADGNEITASTTFTAETKDGSVDVEFTFNGVNLAGKTTVVFETLTYEGIEVAVHADIEDEGQTIYFPELETTAKDSETENNTSLADKSVTIVDTVAYKNLIPGKEYTVEGKLVVKSSGEILKDAEGNEITASTTFTAETSEGTVDVTFTFDGSLLAGETLVCFESLKHQNIEVAVHADINDKDQTIYFPAMDTLAKDDKDGDREVAAKSDVSITDTVTYDNLAAGKTYVVKGVIMDKNTKEAVKGAEASIEFTAEATNGYIDLTYSLNTTGLENHTIVVFAEIVEKDTGVTVAEHKDWDAEGQTLTIPYTPDVPETGDSINITLLIGLMLMSMLCVLLAKKKIVD